ncbi:unnamed protein product [Owenia fusiformis]|uniref:Uncharacterized protein n=1 Tax=Owenia fusiformis TaxID=6347 RepID=A0A8J1TMH1_OWEFU|nr:unnamed protein product [Owenia fusiformis]
MSRIFLLSIFRKINTILIILVAFSDLIFNLTISAHETDGFKLIPIWLFAKTGGNATKAEIIDCHLRIFSREGGNIALNETSPILGGQTIVICNWVLETDLTYSISLYFKRLHLPPIWYKEKCLFGSLKYGLYDNLDRRVIEKEVCGDPVVQAYETSRHKVWLEYTSSTLYHPYNVIDITYTIEPTVQAYKTSRHKLWLEYTSSTLYHPYNVLDITYTIEPTGSYISQVTVGVLCGFVIPLLCCLPLYIVYKRTRRDKKRTKEEKQLAMWRRKHNLIRRKSQDPKKSVRFGSLSDARRSSSVTDISIHQGDSPPIKKRRIMSEITPLMKFHRYAPRHHTVSYMHSRAHSISKLNAKRPYHFNQSNSTSRSRRYFSQSDTRCNTRGLTPSLSQRDNRMRSLSVTSTFKTYDVTNVVATPIPEMQEAVEKLNRKHNERYVSFLEDSVFLPDSPISKDDETCAYGQKKWENMKLNVNQNVKRNVKLKSSLESEDDVFLPNNNTTILFKDECSKQTKDALSDDNNNSVPEVTDSSDVV